MTPHAGRRFGWRRHAIAAALCGCLTACGGGGPTTRSEADPQSKLRVAEAAEISGDRDLATSMYASAAAMAPEDTLVQVRGAMGLARNGKAGPARELLNARLKVTPRDPVLLRALAAVHVVSGQTRQAIARLDEALALSPGDLDALVNKAVALDLEARHADAQALYRRALATAPNDPAISNDYALSLLMSGKAREAQEVLAPFADADAIPERIRVNLGIIYAVNGDTARARALLDGRVDDVDLARLVRAVGQSAAATIVRP